MSDIELPEVFSTPAQARHSPEGLVDTPLARAAAIRPRPHGRQQDQRRDGQPAHGQGSLEDPEDQGSGERQVWPGRRSGQHRRGRLPHPPRSEKVIYRKINVKERKLALDTAIAFTGDGSAVAWRGHKTGKLKFPLVVSDDLEALEKTSALESFLRDLGLADEMKRVYGGVKRRSGKARMRGQDHEEEDRAAHSREQRQGSRKGGGIDPWRPGRPGGQPERAPARPGRGRRKAHHLDKLRDRGTRGEVEEEEGMKVEA